MTVSRKSFSTSSSKKPPKFLSLGRAWCQMGQEDQKLAKNDQNTNVGPKLAIFGPILAKLSLCLCFAAPKFYSLDLYWLLLAAKLITVHEQATLIPVSIDLCTVRRDGAPDFRRIYVPIFGIMTILIISGAPDFSSGAHFLQGWLAQVHISQKKRKWSKSGALRFSRAWVGYISKGRQCLVETKATYIIFIPALYQKSLV